MLKKTKKHSGYMISRHRPSISFLKPYFVYSCCQDLNGELQLWMSLFQLLEPLIIIWVQYFLPPVDIEVQAVLSEFNCMVSIIFTAGNQGSGVYVYVYRFKARLKKVFKTANNRTRSTLNCPTNY